MNDVMKLDYAAPRDILQTAIEQNVSAIMSYQSKGKWHVVKVLLTKVCVNTFKIELAPKIKPHPMNINIGQNTVVSFKHEHGKLIFDTTVISLEPSPNKTSGGIIALAIPLQFELVQRRNYYRVRVPQGLIVNVKISHHSPAANQHHRNWSPHYWIGKLVDLSAGGTQVAIDAADKPDFKPGQSITMCFAPMPNESPLQFQAQIRAILPTADQNNICLGLQITGLESNPEGRVVLRRLCNVIERYHQINQLGVKEKDLQTVSS